MTLEVIRYNGRVCLVCTGDDHTMKEWDLQLKHIMTMFANGSFVKRMKAFRNGGKACLASVQEN